MFDPAAAFLLAWLSHALIPAVLIVRSELQYRRDLAANSAHATRLSAWDIDAEFPPTPLD